MPYSNEPAADLAVTKATAHGRALWPGALVAVAFGVCYAQVIASMVGQWWLNDRYSYGFLIPALSFYLVWIERRELAALRPAPSYLTGAPLLLAGLGMHAAGAAGSAVDLQYLSLIVTLAGLVLLVLGFEFFKRLSFPIIYLLLMVPIWEYLTEPLHLPFQKFSANLGVAQLQWMGVPAYREDIYIFLPRMTLEVARECSGVNYLVAVIALGIPLGYVFLASWTRRILLIVFSVIIAILSNALRVTFIGALLYYGLSRDLHGPGHILQGLLVSLMGYAAIFVGLWFLSRGGPRRVPPEPEPVRQLKGAFSVGPLCLGVAAVLLGTGSFVHFYRSRPVPLKRSLAELPATLGEWRGRPATLDFPVFHDQGIDHELYRIYRNPHGEEVRLYIGYYTHSREDRELIQWRSRNLHLGAKAVEVPLGAAGLPAPLAVNWKLEQRLPLRTLALFWYEVAGKGLTGSYATKAQTVWNAMTRRRSDGAVVLLRTDLEDEGGIARAESSLKALLREVYPRLGDYLPD